MYMDASTQHIPTSLLLLHLFSHNLWYQLQITEDRRWLVWHWHYITTSQVSTYNTPFVTPSSSLLPASSSQPPCSLLLLPDAHVPWLWYGQICMRQSMGKWEENTITPSNGDYINNICPPISCNTYVTSAAYNRQQLNCRHYGVDWLHNKTTTTSFLKVLRTHVCT